MIPTVAQPSGELINRLAMLIIADAIISIKKMINDLLKFNIIVYFDEEFLLSLLMT